MFHHRIVLSLAAAGLAAASATAASALCLWEHPQTAPPKHERQAPAVVKNFDNLDCDVFSKQKWDRLKESHAALAGTPTESGPVSFAPTTIKFPAIPRADNTACL
jgi:hypothetical protein